MFQHIWFKNMFTRVFFLTLLKLFFLKPGILLSWGKPKTQEKKYFHSIPLRMQHTVSRSHPKNFLKKNRRHNVCFCFCVCAHLWFRKSCLKCFKPGKKRLVKINISNQGHTMGDWCNLALGKDHPKGSPSLFSLLAEAGLADLAEPWAERAGFHLFRSDQTSLTSAVLWRNRQMKVREFHYVHLSKCWGGAKMGLKSKAAEGEEPHSCLQGLNSEELNSNCCVPLNSWGTAVSLGSTLWLHILTGPLGV